MRFTSLALIFSIISTIPLFCQWDLVDVSINPILTSLSSNTFQLAVVISSSTSFPMLVDLVFTIWKSPSGLFYGRALVNLVVLIVLIVPNMVILLYVIPSENIPSLLFLIRVRLILTSCIILGFINDKIESVLFQRLCFLTAICFSSGMTFSIYGPFSSTSNKVWISFTAAALSGLGVLLLIALSTIAFKHFRKMSEFHDINQDEYFSCSLLIALLILAPGILIVNTARYFSNLVDIDGSYLIAHLVLYSVVFILFCVFVQRWVHRDAEMIKMSLTTTRLHSKHMSSEMRTPLNCVVIGLDLLRDRLSESDMCQEEMQIIDEINKSCDIAVNILDNMITTDFLENNSIELNKTKLNVWRFIDDVVKPYKHQAIQSQINLSVNFLDIDSNNITQLFVMADKQSLSQVMGNLLSNAMKVTPPGGAVTVTVKTVKKYYECVLQVEVKDTGCGITKGTITAISDGIGRGSVFSIQLPLHTEFSNTSTTFKIHSIITTSFYSTSIYRWIGNALGSTSSEKSNSNPTSSLMEYTTGTETGTVVGGIRTGTVVGGIRTGTGMETTLSSRGVNTNNALNFGSGGGGAAGEDIDSNSTSYYSTSTSPPSSMRAKRTMKGVFHRRVHHRKVSIGPTSSSTTTIAIANANVTTNTITTVTSSTEYGQIPPPSSSSSTTTTSSSLLLLSSYRKPKILIVDSIHMNRVMLARKLNEFLVFDILVISGVFGHVVDVR
eukprot:gene4980-9953_t